MTERFVKCALFFVVSALMASSCGYSLVAGSQLPDDVKVVRIARVDAGALDPQFADMLARELRAEFRRRGMLTPAAEGQAADAVLHVSLTHDRVRALAFDEFDDVLDYASTVAVDASLMSDGGSLLWSAEKMAASRGHAAVAGAVVRSSAAFQTGERLDSDALDQFEGVQLGEERRLVARERIARDLAATIYVSMTEGF
jgi:hypothetical protein